MRDLSELLGVAKGGKIQKQREFTLAYIRKVSKITLFKGALKMRVMNTNDFALLIRS